MTMVEKFNKQFAKVDLYKKSKHHEPVFAVAHYAGIVSVSSGFSILSKNLSY